MEPCNTFRYRLETFTEYRSSEQARKPHEGEVADFYTQPAPQPWEVQATPTKFFTDEKKEIRVPFTSTVQDCSECQAKGKIPCKKCDGKGYRACSLCDGSGRRDDEVCSHCSASGKDRCGSCSGTGQKKCELCDGKCRLLSYIKLKVEWTNHVDNLVVQDQSGLKSDCLQSVSGKELFKNSGFMAYPLLGFPNPAISDASERLTREHQSKYAQNSRILQQRQTVELIPVTKVNYKWKDHAYSFIVYGSERKVQADDYPDSCVCCVIL
ncbi:protein SSUH2 homolog [Oryzias melastigma]|uniref:protein SSUH2 homolog n=1 Tax=Oryzias melastigma TaxID=30732 RepID=UPI000CF8175D|nr:protein SSUH2 homolog [Oryzias melastigma]